MTEAELAAIAARADAASKGPWRYAQIPQFGPMNFILSDDPKAEWYKVIAVCENCGVSTGEFLAHSRQDIPALLAEVRRLQKALRHIESHCFPCSDGHCEYLGKIARRALEGE